MSLFHYNSKTEGTTPYGWCLDSGRVTKYGPEQSVIKQIVQLNQSGLSAYAIAKAFNDAGIRSRCNGKWTYNQVRRVLDRYYREND